MEIYPDGITENYQKQQLKEVELKSLEDTMPRTDQLPFYNHSSAFKSNEILNLLEGSDFDRALFLYQHALQYNWSFQAKLRKAFKKSPFTVSGEIQSNLIQIAQQISNNYYMFKVSDMICGTVTVQDIAQIKTAYETIKSSIPGLDVLNV